MSEPKVLGIKTTVFTCITCGTWYGWIPDFDDLGMADQCQRCGGTGFRSRPGRAIGPRSRYWPSLAEEVKAMQRSFAGDDYAMAELNRTLVLAVAHE